MSEKEVKPRKKICGNCEFCHVINNEGVRDVSKPLQFACFLNPPVAHPISVPHPMDPGQVNMATMNVTPQVSENRPACGSFKE